LALALSGILLAVALAACQKSSAPGPRPLERRGQPINSPVATNIAPPQLASPAPTNRNVAATNAVVPAAPPSDYDVVGFDKLAGYNFEITDDLLSAPTNDLAGVTARTEAQIPQDVKALNKKRVSLKGFMLPLKVEGGLVTELLVMKDQSMCCYGVQPKINEWVSVKMVKGGIKPIMDQPVTLFGLLRVGEMRENGYLIGIYGMDGDKMAGPGEN
jgi:hypothetical protein